MSALNRLFRKHRKDVELFVVYIREAHPSDGRRPDPELDVRSPRTLLERGALAGTCTQDLGLELPMLVDTLDDATEGAYHAWPDRLFLIDRAGKVAYRGAPGPRGFRPDELEAAIERELRPAK